MQEDVVSTSTIIVAKRSEESRIASLMTLAFANDPVMRYLYPDQLQFLTHFPEFVRLFGGKAFDRCSAHITEHGFGAALWLPPDEQPDEEALVELVIRSAADSAKAELFQVFQQMSSYHPEEPHWYLPLIGVDPLYQGGGIGSALLTYALALCDREKRLAYLESSNPKGLPLYQRHGFEVVGTIDVGKHPTIIPMLRKPR
jgi:ribosomal protein S18 acetylase RimI-like enzyme